MKRTFLLLFFIALFRIGLAQDSETPIIDTSSKTTKADSAKPLKIKLTGTFISAGINATQYHSSAFFSYLYTAAGFAKALYNIKKETYFSGDTVLNKFDYSNPPLCVFLSTGLELNANGHKKLHHIIELSYMHFSGSYSGYAYYEEADAVNGNSSWANVYDTVQGKYSQTVLSIGYKFQPTFKFIFLSAGINCSLTIVKAEEHKNEQTNSGWSNEYGVTVVNPPSYNSSYYSGNFNFINFPIQLGIGGVIHKSNLFLEPAFYYTSCFMKGYDMYNLSLKILFPRKKK